MYCFTVFGTLYLQKLIRYLKSVNGVSKTFVGHVVSIVVTKILPLKYMLYYQLKITILNMTTYDTFDFFKKEIYEICMFCYPITVEKTMGIALQHILTYPVLPAHPAWRAPRRRADRRVT